MGAYWGHLEVLLGSYCVTMESLYEHGGLVLGHLEIFMRASLDRNGKQFKSSWGHFGFALMSSWVILGISWDHVGVIWGSLCEAFRVVLRQSWVVVGMLAAPPASGIAGGMELEVRGMGGGGRGVARMGSGVAAIDPTQSPTPATESQSIHPDPVPNQNPRLLEIVTT